MNLYKLFRRVDVEMILDYLDKFTIIVATFAAVFSGISFYKRRKDNDLIRIIIEDKEMPIRILRKQVSRAEVCGILGSLHSGDKYNIAYLKNPEFFKKINKIGRGKLDCLEIPLIKGDVFEYEETLRWNMRSWILRWQILKPLILLVLRLEVLLGMRLKV